SINAPRQKTQAIVKQACARAGIELELKSVVPSVFFSSDAANPDTYGHFYADLQMYNVGMNAPDPQVFMAQFVSWEIASRENKWTGRNPMRFRSDEYDRLWRAAETEMDAVKRAALFIRMNDLVIANVAVIPVLWRNGVGALRVLWWQGSTLLNPHFAVGTKDQDGSRIFYEPLAVWDPEGNLVPVLAAEVPSLQNGAVAKDGRSVTWKLKKNVQWHDGKPFTADDVVFNWEYAADPASACTTSGTYKDIKADK